MQDTETLLTLEEVADRLGKSRDWVYRQCLHGVMPHRKFGNVRKLTESDFAEYLDRTKNKDPWVRSNVSRGKRGRR